MYNYSGTWCSILLKARTIASANGIHALSILYATAGKPLAFFHLDALLFSLSIAIAQKSSYKLSSIIHSRQPDSCWIIINGVFHLVVANTLENPVKLPVQDFQRSNTRY